MRKLLTALATTTILMASNAIMSKVEAAMGMHVGNLAGLLSPAQNTGMSHEITLGEEEISDVSLATFYVFDKLRAAD
jgi:hypothetical protein